MEAFSKKENYGGTSVERIKGLYCLEQCTTGLLLLISLSLQLAILQAAQKQREEEQSGSEEQKRGRKIKSRGDLSLAFPSLPRQSVFSLAFSVPVCGCPNLFVFPCSFPCHCSWLSIRFGTHDRLTRLCLLDLVLLCVRVRLRECDLEFSHAFICMPKDDLHPSVCSTVIGSCVCLHIGIP